MKTHVLTTPRDVQYLPFPTNYKSDLSAKEVMGTLTHAGDGAASELPICFGYGDGGGGPTEDLLAKARAYRAFPGMPQLRMSTVKAALEALEAGAEDLPVWTGEHYLEGHRGVYTSQGWIKRANRRAERALHQAEALAAMAGQSPDLAEAWKLLCLNQFHDIVTGTSVGEVYEDARRDYDRIHHLSEVAVELAADALAGPEPSLANLLPTRGPRTVEIGTDVGASGQKVEGGFLGFFDALPPYSLAPLGDAVSPDVPVSIEETDEGIVLTNAHLRAVLRDGALVSLTEVSTGAEVIKPGESGNALLAFEDRPICWDAWDIDPHYEDRQDRLDPPISIVVTETGPLRAAIRLEHRWRNSRITQTVTLTADSRRLDFHTVVDWHETHVLLKVAFPVSFSAPEALYDIQWGTICRPTNRTSDFDAARFEVPAQKWALLTDGNVEVALMNDCKYGYDVREDRLRLTLIKSATSPDRFADQGHHEFTYGLYAAPAGSVEARNHAAYDLNTPVRVIDGDKSTQDAPDGAFVEVSSPNVIIETVKPSDRHDGMIVRLFECTGSDTACDLGFSGQFRTARLADIFENDLSDIACADGTASLNLRGFEILTVLLLR